MKSSVAADWINENTEVHGVSGSEYVIKCPWCGKPKLYANPDKLLFLCFRCQQKGRLSRLVAFVLRIDQPQAERLIKSRAGIDEDDLQLQLRELELGISKPTIPPVNHPLPSEFIPCFSPSMGWQVPQYLDDRGVSESDIIRHGLGFATQGRYRNRVIVPIVCGKHRTFLGRLMGRPKVFTWKDDRTKRKIQPTKYLAPKGANLSDVLYGTSWVKPGSDLIGVEGCFDAIRLIGLGFSAVGFFGKRITKKQARLLRGLKPKSFTLLFDSGALSYAYSDALQLAGTMSEVYVGRLIEGEDPDSLGLHGGRVAIQEVLNARRPAGNPLDSLAAALDEL